MTVLRVISLGAGVQSTCMALMAAHGEIGPMPDCAIFADTQWEPAHVYTHLDRLETRLPFPVYRVTEGNLRKAIATTHKANGRYMAVPVPVYVRSDGGGPDGMTNRSCTRDYKITPIRRKVRELLGIAGKRSPSSPVVEQWIGISLDEVFRMKPAREAWTEHRWPLIEARMTRNDCLRWMERNGYPEPKKSSCIGCPFHSDDQWRALSPTEFADAVDVDRRLRAHPPGVLRKKGELYLHRSCKPLEDVDFSTASDWGQLDMFLNECEGMCGV